MDVVPALPFGVAELREWLLARCWTLDEAFQDCREELTYAELRGLFAVPSPGLSDSWRAGENPERVDFLAPVPEEHELLPSRPARLEAGILKLFIGLQDGQGCTEDAATIPKRQLLFALSRAAPREGFRSWSQRALLQGIQDLELNRESFCEAVVLQNGHVEDAKEWFQLLCASRAKARLPPGYLAQAALRPRLAGACDAAEPWQLQELAVRLISVWGDLSTAFRLGPAQDELDGRCSSPATQMAKTHAAKLGRPRKLSARQWQRALRGKPACQLLSEVEARTESERLAGLSPLDRLFPNLSDRLLVNKNLWLPGELIWVSYNLSDFGYWGCGGLPPLVQGKLQLGRQPFVALVPQPEMAGHEEPVPASRAPLDPFGGAVPLRAPRACAALACWQLRLFASEDGETPLTALSQPLFIQVMSVPPAPPSDVTLAEQTKDTLTVTWAETLRDGGSDLLHYELGLWQDGEAVETIQTSEPPLTVPGLKPGKSYVVRVRSVNSLGPSPWSPVLAASAVKTVPVPGQLAAPFPVEVGTSDVLLRWVPEPGFRVGCHLLRAEPQDADGEELVQKCDGGRTEMLFTGLANFTRYRFSIAALNSHGRGPWSSSVEACTQPDLPGAPQLLSCEVDHSSLHIKWKPPTYQASGVLDYVLRASGLDPNQASEILVAAPPARVDGLLGNTTYRVSVAARNVAGVGDSAILEVTMPVRAPSAPRSFEMQQRLRWQPPADNGGAPVEKYILQVAGPEGEREITCFGDDGEPGWKGACLPSLGSATEYRLALAAVNAAGRSEFAQCQLRTAAVPGPPEPPRVLRQLNNLRLRWKMLKDCEDPVLQYEVRVALSDKRILAQTVVEGLQVKLAGLELGGSYCAQLRAQTAAGWSPWSRWSTPRCCAQVPGRPSPPRPLVQRSAWSLFVEWDVPESDSHLLEYELWCGQGSSGPAPTEGRRIRATRTAAKVTGLTASTRYVFRVRALNDSGWSPWSAPSEVACTSDARSTAAILSAVWRHFGGIEAAFRAFDRDADGCIGRNDFVFGLGLVLSVPMEQRMRMFEAAGRSCLAYEDFAALFPRSHLSLPSPLPGRSPRPSRAGSPDAGAKSPCPRGSPRALKLGCRGGG